MDKLEGVGERGGGDYVSNNGGHVASHVSPRAVWRGGHVAKGGMEREPRVTKGGVMSDGGQ